MRGATTIPGEQVASPRTSWPATDDGTDGCRQLVLLRQPAVVAIPAHAAVHRQTRPTVHVSLTNSDVESSALSRREVAFVVVLQPADLRRRRNAEDHLVRRRRCCRRARCCRPHPAARRTTAAPSASRAPTLIVWLPLAGVEEVRGRTGPLLAIAIVLVLLVRADDLQRAGIAEEVGSVPLVICGK